MRYPRRFLLVWSTVAVAFVVLGASSAGAATLVGPDITGTSSGTHNCLATCERAQYLEGTASTGSPVDGVIVRWRVRPQSASGGQISLRTFRPLVGTFQARAIATGPALAVPAGTSDDGAPVQQAVRIPIRSGDLVGVRHTSAVNIGFKIVTARGISGAGPLADGAAATFNDNGADRILLNADVEPDADKDNFGDETQDQCPSKATTQGPCGGPATFGTTATAKNGKSFGVKVACPAGPAACAGSVFARSSKRLKLSTKGQRKVTGLVSFGDKAFSVTPGTTKTISFSLNKADRALLKRLKKIKVALTIVNSDGTTKKGSATIKTPKVKKKRKR